ncbi:hypothetical protein UPYG_G00246360 [Umbra pygmaea]|uniref:Uncharacterized protein n=1 Tax=Umbra pygmaea TaxID=75934 RepID=A0ABD0WYK0_UMBPY
MNNATFSISTPTFLSHTTSSTSSTPHSSSSTWLYVFGALAAVLSICLIIVLVLICYHKKNKDEPRDVTYADITIKQDQECRKQREKSPGTDPVYSAVKNSKTTGDLTYADIKHKRQHDRKRDKAIPDPVYSAVKTNRNTGGAATRPREVSYGQVEIKTKKKRREKQLPPDPDVVYPSVRPLPLPLYYITGTSTGP